MEFSFPDADINTVTQKIMEKLGNRELGKMVSFHPSAQGLEVVISKLGTSKLFFSKTETNGHSNFKLEREKIALAHKAFKSEVTEKICKVIIQAGGTVKDA